MRIVRNTPLNLQSLKELVVDDADLQLMLPDALLPFNEAQWLALLDESKVKSFFIQIDGLNVGHFSLHSREARDEVTLCYVYLEPASRKSGAAREMLLKAEKTAVEAFAAQTMYLNVRSFNLPAFHLYLRCGYQEYNRTGPRVQMKKSLISQGD